MGRAVPGETSTIMKVFAVLLLAALAYAAPEADPEADAAADAWYAYYGYGHPGYYGYYGLGWGGYYGGYYGYPIYGYRYWKRDAEAGNLKMSLPKRPAKRFVIGEDVLLKRKLVDYQSGPNNDDYEEY